jgi:hypothetical protein
MGQAGYGEPGRNDNQVGKRTKRKTRPSCTSTNVRACKVSIQPNNVEADERGHIHLYP